MRVAVVETVLRVQPGLMMMQDQFRVLFMLVNHERHSGQVVVVLLGRRAESADMCPFDDHGSKSFPFYLTCFKAGDSKNPKISTSGKRGFTACKTAGYIYYFALVHGRSVSRLSGRRFEHG